jgi:hypothetical protein
LAVEPPQADVIEKILRHCGLWRESSPRPPPEEAGLVYVPDNQGDGWSELDFVLDSPWEQEMPSSDEPWEVGYPLAGGDAYGDSFDASF